MKMSKKPIKTLKIRKKTIYRITIESPLSLLIYFLFPVISNIII